MSSLKKLVSFDYIQINMYQVYKPYSQALESKYLYHKIIIMFLSFILNICFVRSKEPSVPRTHILIENQEH